MSDIFGIDLGTTYSCISYVDEFGKPVVLPNSDNQLTTPSVVFIEGKDDIIVGKYAAEAAMEHPDRVVSMIKRFMGDPAWVIDLDGETYTPQDISSFILRQLAKDAKETSGKEVEDVVITVPAYFGLNRREATKQAGELAGLNVLYVLSEPTAAALAYGIEKGGDQTVLVYDLGGGTFDISLVKIEGNKFKVLCTDGDHDLGGKRWDEEIASYFAKCYANERGNAAAITDNPETWQEVLQLAEECKRTLTSRNEVKKTIQPIEDADKFVLTLSRETFDEITSSLLERTFAATDKLLAAAEAMGVDKSSITQLLMVGGSCYMKQVEEGVKARYPGFAIQMFDPNQSVAKGAAISAYSYHLKGLLDDLGDKAAGEDDGDTTGESVSREEREKAIEAVAEAENITRDAVENLVGIEFTDVTSKSFGVVVVDDQEKECVTNLIVQNDSVPLTITKTFPTYYADQEGVAIRCIESNNPSRPGLPFELNPEQEIGSAELTFDRAMPEGALVDVTFCLSSDGLLSISAMDHASKREVKAEFKTESILSPEEMAKKKKRNMAIRLA